MLMGLILVIMNYISTVNRNKFVGAVQVKDIAKELDMLTHLVVTAALAAKRNDQDQNAQQELDKVQRLWLEKVQQLTSAIDDMFSPQELVAATGELHNQCQYFDYLWFINSRHVIILLFPST